MGKKPFVLIFVTVSLFPHYRFNLMAYIAKKNTKIAPFCFFFFYIFLSIFAFFSAFSAFSRAWFVCSFCPLCLLAFGVCFAGILRGRGTARLGAAHGRRCVGVARLGGG
ncbi:hypothetical protein V6Z11_D10G186400 [Gossypium hirsutum]